MMEEPQVTSYVRPLFPQEREERGTFSLEENQFVIAFDTHVTKEGNKTPILHFPLPPEIGSI